MQIDFHHGATFALARLAGFDIHEASIIAYSSQYVDDATNDGLIRFRNHLMYKRISSSHPMISIKNVKFVSSREAWGPFHFLPGNEGEGINKTICRPNSVIAKEMVNSCIGDRKTDGIFSLHRLGITAHVYADTWAHQDFTGLNIPLNDVDRIECVEKKTPKRIAYHLKKWARYGGHFIGDFFPLGHGAVLTYPDLPYLEWSYFKPGKEEYKRNNTEIFLEAATHLYSFFKNYQNNDLGHTIHKIPEKDFIVLRQIFANIRDEDPKVRYEYWQKSILRGDFSFGPEILSYVDKGEGSWKEMALNTSHNLDHFWHRFDFQESFLTSNWKMFHDALQVHRTVVMHKILPKYGICAV